MVSFTPSVCLISTFLSLATAKDYLFEARQSPGCTGVAKKPPPSGFICNQQGSVGSEVLVIGATRTQTQALCLDSCLNDYPNCIAFAYGPGKHCEIYDQPIIQSGWKRGNTGKTFWNRNCYTSTCHCPSGTGVCYGNCMNLQTDNNNCGKCNHQCEQNAQCTNGKCFCATTCSGQCVNTMTASSNCGACGNVCQSDAYCNGGSCVCPEGGVPGDNNNCGTCGTQCGSNASCEDNATCTCNQGFTDCSGNCVDETSDINNCGQCGNQCGPNETCNNGSCECPNGGTLGDNNNCGTCGTQCASNASCEDNATCTCNQGFTDCSGNCVDETSDINNCGQCGIQCGPNETCNNGSCECPNGGTLGDNINCGACGTQCGSNAFCQVNGTCTCNQGFTDCSGSCVDTSSDPNHCSACGNACTSPSGEICYFGMCICNPFTDLPSIPCNGMCLDPASDNNNCGSCGTVCPSGYSCVLGGCENDNY